MKSKVMGVDAANRRKNANIKVTASGGKNPGANLKPMSKPSPMGGAAGGGGGGGGKMPRPQPRPESKMAPKSSMRPRTRSDKQFEVEADAAADRAMKHSQPPKLVNKAAGGKITKMMGGGMCRGMGAAKKGGSYSKGA